jgi:predicted RNase H-like HicB family nuclease
MNAEYTAVLKQDGDWWIGWIEVIPGVNCQERTKTDLLASLREVLAEERASLIRNYRSEPLWQIR